MSEFNIKPEYKPRCTVLYDSHVVEGETVWQPHVYDLAIMYANRYNCTNIIDVGCGSARKLAPYLKDFKVTGIDYKDNLKFCKESYPEASWVEHDLESEFTLKIPKGSIIICADVVEHLKDPTGLLLSLRNLLDQGTMLLLSTPLRKDASNGPPQRHHFREWAFDELVGYVSSFMPLAWIGTTKSNSTEGSSWITSLLICTNGIPRNNLEVPEVWAR